MALAPSGLVYCRHHPEIFGTNHHSIRCQADPKILGRDLKNTARIRIPRRHKPQNNSRHATDGNLENSNFFNALESLKLPAESQTRKKSEISRGSNYKSRRRDERSAVSSAKDDVRAESESRTYSQTPDSDDSDQTSSQLNSDKPSLRGQDVLLALQRAAMEKAKNDRGGRGRGGRRKSYSLSKKQGSVDSSGKDFRDVKPIVIKHEWTAKIQSLEKRLREVKETLELM